MGETNDAIVKSCVVGSYSLEFSGVWNAVQ